MIQIVYRSRAVRAFSAADLVALLEHCRRNNDALGVTGMLLHHAGQFLQVLEGDASIVRALYVRIASDPRHTEAVVVHHGQSDHRDFPDWSMGFRDLDEAGLPELAGFSRFLHSGITAAHFAADPPRAKALLLAFKAAGEHRRRESAPPAEASARWPAA